MFDEITRILNHLMWLGAHGLDIGAMSVFLFCFREREDLMDCYEAVSGTRMHATYYRPGGVYRDLPDTMPKYQASRWRSKKDADRLNEARSGLAARFHRGLHAAASRPASTSTKRCSPTTASGSSARSTSAWSRPSARCSSASPARCCAVRASPGICARSSRTKSIRDGFRHSGRRQRRLLRPLPGAHRGDAPVEPHRPAVRGVAARESGPGDGRRPQGRAAEAARR